MLARKKRGRRDAAVRDTLKSVRSTVDTVVRRLVGSTDPEYEDLVQSSLVNVLATFDGGKFRGECPPRGWAAVIARNVAVDAIRARARERRVFAHDGDALADERGRAEGDLGPERLTDLHETLDRVNLALSRPGPEEGPRRLSARRARIPAGRGCDHAGDVGRRGSVAPGARPPRDHREDRSRIGPRGAARAAGRARRSAAPAAQAALPRANLTAGFRGLSEEFSRRQRRYRRYSRLPNPLEGPMAAFGTLTLLIALVVATYAGVASLIGARRGNRRLIASGRAGVYALAAVLGLSSVALVYAFVSHDYSIKYVHHYSDAASPLFYQITAYWGGLDGSILWWVFLLSVFSAIAIYTNRNRHRELLPYAVTVLMAIADFFLFVIIFYKNPFDTYLTDIPTVGQGAEPAPAERVHGDPPAVALHGLRRHEHPVRVRDGRR